MVIQTNLGDFYRNYIKLNCYIRRAGVTASFMLTLISLLAIFPIVPKTDLAEAAAGAAKASETTLSMTMGSENASLDLSPSNVDGTFAASKENELAKFGITTDNYTGYTLSISANNDDGVLTNTDTTITSNNTLSTITSVTDTTTFTDSTVFNGKWGYKPSKYNSTVNTSNFYPAPTTTSSTLDVTANPNNESNNYTIGLGARADYTKPAGTYTSTFTLTAVGNPVPYTITYADNSGDATVANLPAPSSDLTRNTSILITSAAPTRDHYTLKSWCLGTVSDSGTVCTGTEYLPGASFGIDQTTTNTTTLYAVWELASYLQTIQVRYQNANGSWGNYSTYNDCTKNVTYGSTHSCSIAASGAYQSASLSSYTVTNTNTKYIDISRKVFVITVSNSNTSSGKSSLNVLYGGSNAVTVTPDSGYYLSGVSCPSGYSCTGYSTGEGHTSQQTVTITHTTATSNGTLGFTGSLSCQKFGSTTMQEFDPSRLCSGQGTSGTLTDSRDNQTYMVAKLADNKWWLLDNLRLGAVSLVQSLSTSNTNMSPSVSFTLPASSTDYTSYTSPKINTSFANNIDTDPDKRLGIGSHKYGVYYNYCAASAGTYCMPKGSNSGDATYDVCPKGWRLPTGSLSGEFYALYNSYSDDAISVITALSVPFAGVGSEYEGPDGSTNFSAGYWTSTFYTGTTSGYAGNSMHIMTASISKTKDHYSFSSGYIIRPWDYSLRCVLK